MLYNDSTFSDVTLHISEDPRDLGGQENARVGTIRAHKVYAHKAILANVSTYFYDLFMSEPMVNTFHIFADPVLAIELLKWIYSHHVKGCIPSHLVPLAREWGIRVQDYERILS